MTDDTRTTSENTESESWTEQRFRADYVRAANCHRDPDDYDQADRRDYEEYASPWVLDPEWGQEWTYLAEAHTRWNDNSVEAAAQFEREGFALSPVQLRSEEQARYLAEHGIERDERSNLVTGRYVERVQAREDAERGLPDSALADYQPGNALATDWANERKGMRR